MQRLVTKHWKLFRCKLQWGTIFQGGIIKYKIRHSFVFILDGFLDKDKDKFTIARVRAREPYFEVSVSFSTHESPTG